MSLVPSLASLADGYYSSGDPFVADELVELLTDLIKDAGSEDGLSTVLAQIEDIVVNDIVRSASSSSQLAAPDPTAHSGSGRADVASPKEIVPMETLLQATSITLLPILVRLPASSAEAAESVLRLVLLTAQRANPKELLVGLEQALARLALGNDGEDWEEEPGSQLGRILLAARVAIPGIKTRRLAPPLCSFLEVLREAATLIGEALDNDDTASPEADFLLSSILELLSTLAAFLSSNGDIKEADRSQVSGEMRQALLDAGQSILPSASGSAQLASSEKCEPSSAPHAIQLLATVNVLDLNLKTAFRHSSSNRCQEAHAQVVAVLLAYELRSTETSSSPLDADLALDMLRAFPGILAGARTRDKRRLAAMAADGSLYLLRSALKRLQLNDEVIGSTGRAIDAICTHLDDLPAHLLPPSIALLAYAVREFPQDSPGVQDELLAHLLGAGQATHIRSIGIQILRSMLLDGSLEATNRIAAFTARYGGLILEYTSPSTVELFMQDKTQTYLVSILNLLYLVYQRDRLARKSDLWQASHLEKVQQSFIEPMQADVRRWSEAMSGDDHPDESIRIVILQDALDRLVGALA